ADEAGNQGESAAEPAEGAVEDAPATADSPEPAEAAAEEAAPADEPVENAEAPAEGEAEEKAE
ncbi:MAG TPA: hypothetical protein VFU20_07565, partial [Sphingomicrobium sp.]|nr:hypothetical protein [Sphingomicrobium sp.]